MSPRLLLAPLCLALLPLLACQDPAPEAPSAPAPTASQEVPLKEPGAHQPGTALLVVELSPQGGVRIGAVRPKPVLWVDPLVPYDPALHEPGQSFDPRQDPHDRSGAQRWELAVVARRADQHLVTSLHLLAPGADTGGDVLRTWDSGGAVWRAPWLGEGTSYEVVRTWPAPAVRLSTWKEEE